MNPFAPFALPFLWLPHHLCLELIACTTHSSLISFLPNCLHIIARTFFLQQNVYHITLSCDNTEQLLNVQTSLGRVILYLHTLVSSQIKSLLACVFVHNVSSPWSSQSPWKHSDPVLMIFPQTRSHPTPFWTLYFSFLMPWITFTPLCYTSFYVSLI